MGNDRHRRSYRRTQHREENRLPTLPRRPQGRGEPVQRSRLRGDDGPEPRGGPDRHFSLDICNQFGYKARVHPAPKSSGVSLDDHGRGPSCDRRRARDTGRCGIIRRFRRDSHQHTQATIRFPNPPLIGPDPRDRPRALGQVRHPDGIRSLNPRSRPPLPDVRGKDAPAGLIPPKHRTRTRAGRRFVVSGVRAERAALLSTSSTCSGWGLQA